jgi:hypothetical protein
VAHRPRIVLPSISDPPIRGLSDTSAKQEEPPSTWACQVPPLDGLRADLGLERRHAGVGWVIDGSQDRSWPWSPRLEMADDDL